MDRIAAQYPELVTLGNAGKSYEGRDIKYLKVSVYLFILFLRRLTDEQSNNMKNII